MGSVLSSGSPRSSIDYYDELLVLQSETCKKQKIFSRFDEDSARLIPVFPDELSIQILARLPRLHYLKMRLVSRKWKETIMDPDLYKLRKELGMTEQWLYVLTKVEEENIVWRAMDPLSGKWLRLPPIPNITIEEEPTSLWKMVGPRTKLAEFIRGWLGEKSGSDNTQFCGSGIAAIDGCLYVLGGLSRASTMKNVWRFDPIQMAWSEVTPMSIGRAYCKTSILNNKLYVVGGVTRGPGGLIPLQSAEVFDPCTGTWSQVPSMPFSRAHLLPNAFLADMLKPIATGMISYMGRLHVCQSLYSWPFFFDAGGEIYDPETNSWADMPNGMGDGWPQRQAGTKLSVVIDGELYACDPSTSPMDNGKIKVYDQKEDAWKVVIKNVPINDSTNSDSPYLLAGFHGKLHVITKDENCHVVVLQAIPPDDLCPWQSSSSTSGLLHEVSDSPSGSESVVWKAIGTRDLGPAELVSCQVLEM
ncbi:hypothetical protein COLO4_16495 [Corchorus olitorius]|uniref:F-box domain-containing protein n=1 Tax=Corchorus olitorius TaxID=93759 RepID=A0A1R3JH45_9ROSI|nr:hypothetical protein COLO4_16495 [Corchorus olitorius]